jgi:hypothetical protein
MTTGDGGADCCGAASGCIGGTGDGGALAVVAAAKLAALTTDSAPVRTTAPEIPPVVHEATRRNARSRSEERYSATSVIAASPTAVVAGRWGGGWR